MATVTEPDEGVTAAVGAITTTRKGVRNHAWSVLRRWPYLVERGVVVFTATTAVAGASVFLIDASLEDWRWWLTSALLAATFAVGLGIRSYIRACPRGLESESPTARRVGQFQRRGWEFRLAGILLRDRVARLDRELEDLRSGRAFVAFERSLALDEYIDWLKLRMDSHRRMAEVGGLLITADILDALVSTNGDDAARILALLESADRIGAFYAATVAFDRAGHAVQPPPGWETAHGYTLEWSSAVRDGLHGLIEWLDKTLAKVDARKTHEIDFTITFPAPPSLESFCREADLITEGAWSRE